MRHDKLDLALAEAMGAAEGAGDAEALTAVMILTTAEPTSGQWAQLKRLGVTAVSPRGCVYSARLTPQAVADLAEQPWVRYLELARTLKRMPTVAHGLDWAA